MSPSFVSCPAFVAWFVRDRLAGPGLDVRPVTVRAMDRAAGLALVDLGDRPGLASDRRQVAFDDLASTRTAAAAKIAARLAALPDPAPLPDLPAARPENPACSMARSGAPA